MYWQPISNLHDRDEPIESVYCRICKKRQQPALYANTELAQDTKRGTCSHCNIAFKLPCGHIIVDDCDSDDRNGVTFHNEADWRKEIVSSYDKGW